MLLEDRKGGAFKTVTLDLSFGLERAKDRIFDEFKHLFEAELRKSDHKGDSILRDILFIQEPSNIVDKQTLIAKISSHSSSSAAKTFLVNLFGTTINFELYRLMCEMVLLDYNEYESIRILYDNRLLKQCSFGQRCTAS